MGRHDAFALRQAPGMCPSSRLATPIIPPHASALHQDAGRGHDFVVFDATRQPFSLTPDQMRRLGDRRFGVGCDQILVIEPATASDADFGYRIFNNTGDEVEHCGNGARCFVRYVVDAGLTDKRRVVVDTMNRRLHLQLQDDGRVTVDMAHGFEHAAPPFDVLASRRAWKTASSSGPWRCRRRRRLDGQPTPCSAWRT